MFSARRFSLLRCRLLGTRFDLVEESDPSGRLVSSSSALSASSADRAKAQSRPVRAPFCSLDSSPARRRHITSDPVRPFAMLSTTTSRRVLASAHRQTPKMTSFASALTSTLFTSLHRQMHSSDEPRDPAYRVLTNERMNKHVLEAQYAVRGAIPLRAEELREQLEEKGKDAGLPFDTVVNCNIGNPQQLDQKPLTFLRQVSSLFALLARSGDDEGMPRRRVKWGRTGCCLSRGCIALYWLRGQGNGMTERMRTD